MKGYTVILSPDPNAGGYAVIIPSMPGALTEGNNRDEALRNAAEVMAAWLEVAGADGYGPREETPELLAHAISEVLEDRLEEGWDFSIETAVASPASPIAA